VSWHVAGQVAGPAGVADLEPAEGAEPHGRAEHAQLKEARSVAAALLKAGRAGKKGPFLIALGGHVSTGEPGEPEQHLTVSVAHHNSA
jgi:hypothetical protein